MRPATQQVLEKYLLNQGISGKGAVAEITLLHETL